MANETVTYDLASVLNEIKTDMKLIQATQTTILLNQTKLEGKIDALEAEVKTIKEDMKTVKGTQGQQIWALIGVLATGVIGALIINGWRF